MKGIKHLRLNKRFLALIMAGVMAFSLSGCHKNVEMGDISYTELMDIDDVKNVTIMDELIEEDYLNFDDDLNYVQAADQLEEYMQIVETLKSINFSDVEKLRTLTEEEYQATLDLSVEDVKLLKEVATSKSTSLKDTEDRLVALKELNYLNDYCKDWIKSNGKSISLKLMMSAVKSSVGDEFNIPLEEYSTITIPAHYSSSSGPTDYSIEVGGKTYLVPESQKEIWNTIGYIYTLQSANVSDKNAFETYRKAINYAKVTTAAGANVKNGKIETQYDGSYITKNYLTK